MDTSDGPLLVEFSGPFSWLGEDSPSVFVAPEGQAGGLYVWSISVKGQDVIYYVGLTQKFAVRFLEHFKEHASGGYTLNDPIKFAAGRKEQLWPGRFTKERKSVKEFIDRYEELVPAITALTKLYRFHLAPLTLEKRSVERIEAGLANYLYASPGIVGAFQEEGIHYRSRKPDEPSFGVQFRSRTPLLGLPDKLSV